MVSPLRLDPHLKEREGVPPGKIFLAFFILILFLPLTLTWAQNVATLLQEGDRLWEQRMDTKSFDASLLLYKKALQSNPENYEVNWRISRSYFWRSDQMGDAEGKGHKSLGELGMQYGRTAIKQNPSGIEGHYYYALNLAQYGLGISIVRALVQGLGSEYEEHVKMVLKIDRRYDNGGVLRAMGRYYYKLPWPKRDLDRSIEYLNEASRIAPWCCRGHVYLAESYLKAGKRDMAKVELMTAIKAEGNPIKEVDQSRWKEVARTILTREFREYPAP